MLTLLTGQNSMGIGVLMFSSVGFVFHLELESCHLECGGSLPTHCSQVATTVIIILQLFSFLGVIESTLLLRNLHNIHY